MKSAAHLGDTVTALSYLLIFLKYLPDFLSDFSLADEEFMLTIMIQHHFDRLNKDAVVYYSSLFLQNPILSGLLLSCLLLT